MGSIKLCLFVQHFKVFTHLLSVPGLIVFLKVEDLVNFYLSPDEMSFIISICESPPLISSLEQTLNQHRVVSPSNENLKLLTVSLGVVKEETIIKGNFPYEISIKISLKGRSEGLLLHFRLFAFI